MARPNDSAVDVAIVGGGIIGLAIAWTARARGLSVTVLERNTVGAGTSHVAAGMLAPVAEAEFGPAGQRLLELGLHSARMWPDFAARLQNAAELPVALRPGGTLVLARDDDEARELDRQIAFRDSLALPTTRLLASAARELEPALAPTLRLAYEAPDDHSVDPRLVLAALRRACELSGVQLCEHAAVSAVELDTAGGGDAPSGADAGVEAAAGTSSACVTGVVLADGAHIHAQHVVLAAGAWTGELAGLPAYAQVPVRPVKGQILRLRDPAGPGLLERVVRYHGGYLVPRGDGRYVLGATVEERAFEHHPTAGGIYELLRDAHELVPGIAELAIEELSVGLRPTTPDNAPVIGPGALPGLVWATGHYRNGILLAPLTAELVLATLTGDTPDLGAHTGGSPDLDASSAYAPLPAAGTRSLTDLLAYCAPGRFSTHAARSPTPEPARPPVGVS